MRLRIPEKLLGASRLALYERHGIVDLAALLLVKAGQLPRTSAGRFSGGGAGDIFLADGFSVVWSVA